MTNTSDHNQRVSRLRVFRELQVPFLSVDDLPAGVKGVAIVFDEIGGSVLAFGDGEHWRRSTDRAIVTKG